jgi:hypothetical protein
MTGGLLGAAGVVAVEKVQASREGQMYEQVAELRHAAAVAVEDRTAAKLQEAQKSLDNGIATLTEVAVLQDRHRAAVGDARLALLNLAEVRASRCPPRDELWAPLVVGRDFVSERLVVSANAAKEQVRLAELLVVRQSAEESNGLVLARVFDAAKAKEASAKLALRRSQEYLDVRRQFLQAVANVMETERNTLRIDAEFSVERVKLALQSLQSQLQGLSAAHEAGTVSTAELRELQGKLAEMQGTLTIAQAELQVVQESTGGQGPTKKPAEKPVEKPAEKPAEKPGV